GVLLDHRIFCVGQYGHHFLLRKRVERTDDWQPTDKFRNHFEREQVLGFHMTDSLPSQCLLYFERRAGEAHRFLAYACLYDFVQANESAAADKKNLLSVYPN